MSRANKGLKRHGLRSYIVEGPADSYVIVRDRPWRFLVRNAKFPVIYNDFFAMRFRNLKRARTFAEEAAGLKDVTK